MSPTHVTGADYAWSGFLTDESTRSFAVAPGVVIHRIRGRIPAGPIAMFVLEADRTRAGLSVDAIIGNSLAGPDAVRWPHAAMSTMATEAGAVAAINADFFHIHDTMVPRGLLIASGQVLTSGSAHHATLGFTTEGEGYIGYWNWAGHVHGADNTTMQLSGLNVDSVENDALYIYRAPWSRSPGNNDLFIDSDWPVVEVVLGDVTEVYTGTDYDGDVPSEHGHLLRGVVREVRHNQPGIEIDEGTVVITGFGEIGRKLAAGYDLGDALKIRHGLTGHAEWPHLDHPELLHSAVGGGVVLVRNGELGDAAVISDSARHPRTAVGIPRNQDRLVWLVVDGRSATSVGMTYLELTELFLHMDIFYAINLDGGGSSTLVGRDPGSGRMQVFNTPSDGRERSVPEGLGLFYLPHTD